MRQPGPAHGTGTKHWPISSVAAWNSQARTGVGSPQESPHIEPARWRRSGGSGCRETRDRVVLLLGAMSPSSRSRPELAGLEICRRSRRERRCFSIGQRGGSRSRTRSSRRVPCSSRCTPESDAGCSSASTAFKLTAPRRVWTNPELGRLTWTPTAHRR